MATDSPARVIAMASLANGQTSEEIITQQAVGALPAGYTIEAGTPYSELIPLIFGNAVQTITIYFGASTNIPTSITGLTSKSITNTTLTKSTGYTTNIKAGIAGDPTTTPPVLAQAQYVCFAVPNSGTTYTLDKWAVNNFSYDIPHTKVVDSTNHYDIYYLNEKSYDEDLNGIDYVLNWHTT